MGNKANNNIYWRNNPVHLLRENHCLSRLSYMSLFMFHSRNISTAVTRESRSPHLYERPGTRTVFVRREQRLRSAYGHVRPRAAGVILKQKSQITILEIMRNWGWSGEGEFLGIYNGE